MPPGFRFPEHSDLWVPLHAFYAAYNGDWWKSRDIRPLDVIARLKGGVSIEQAQGEMNAIAGRLEIAYPDTNRGLQVRLMRLRDAEVGNIRPYLQLLTVICQPVGPHKSTQRQLCVVSKEIASTPKTKVSHDTWPDNGDTALL
jgi:hypothetical protein